MVDWFSTNLRLVRSQTKIDLRIDPVLKQQGTFQP